MTQTSVSIVVVVITVALLSAMSLRANRRFRMERRLPMQWWLDGSVTWTAPRPVALAFTPILAAVCLPAVVALTIFGRARPGQEGVLIPAIILVALVLFGFHAFHLWLMQRTTQR